MSVGFVILNYNTSKLTRELAIKISSYDMVSNIIIVDNCSTDNSFEELNLISDKKISVYKTKYNGGYSYGNNLGVNISKKLGNKYTFISNPDVQVCEKTITDIIETLEQYDYSLVTCLQYEIDGSLGQPPILKRNTYLDDLADCLFLTRKISKRINKDIDITEDIQEISMFRGSFFAVDTDKFIKIGGFDEEVFLYCEERILSKKMSLAGMKMAILNFDRYDHMHSMSINIAYQKRYKKIKLQYKSRVLYNKKYNKVGFLRLIILKLFMNISLFEYYVMDMLHGGK